jgi:hypothetical protein
MVLSGRRQDPEQPAPPQTVPHLTRLKLAAVSMSFMTSLKFTVRVVLVPTPGVP